MIINLSNYKGESIKTVGLINPSIYCFMISILQSLISIPELNFFFLSKIYLISSLYNNDNNDNLDEDNLEDNYPICKSYQTFIKIYLLSKKNYIQIPRNLFRICNKLLGGMRMHDSQEFFVCFLEAMQQELNPQNKNKNKKIEKNKKEEEVANKMEEKWIAYRKKNNSFIDSLFTGLMRSTVECKSCKHRSITYDPFIDLNVSINKYKNLEKCLKQYFEPEKIDCEYKCDNCKQISKVS
jgi:ubiquitin C-terminal hydrolase